MTNEITVGSMADLANRQGMSMAESFMSASHIVLIDVSGSMGDRDSRGGRSRFEVACDELRLLQRDMPGKVAVVAFSDDATFCPGGVPVPTWGGTNLAGALQFVSPADGTVTFIVISDGLPDGPDRALAVAAGMVSTIHTVFVGPETGYDAQGRYFLDKLAAAHHGQSVTDKAAMQLAEKVTRLMLSGN